DLGAVAEEVARAASGAAELAEALGALARALRPAGPAPPGDDEGPRPAPAPTGAAPAGGPGAAEDRPDEPAPVRRRPVPLPGGIFDDTVEAAEHLLRTPGVVLVVDGYNVSMQGWPELPVAEQRRRLVTGLGDLAARTSTKVEVVFDGAEVGPLAVPSRTRSQVRVRFSAPDVEADDVILDLVGRIPSTLPVVGATRDIRAREGARAAGAYLVHARLLLALFRRWARRPRRVWHPLRRVVPVLIDCDDCVMQGTAACDDCVVTFICSREPGEAIVVDVAEVRALRLLSSAGLVPELRLRRRTG